MSLQKAYRVVFVCLGNICRSPMAEGTFRALVGAQGLEAHIETDSAGTGAWHVGSPPDRRAQAEMRKRGYDISDLRGRQAKKSDFEHFDLVLAMDMDNFDDLQRLAGAKHQDKLKLFLDFAGADFPDEVPDPYYGGEGGFSHVLDLVEAAAQGLLKHVKSQL